MSVARHDDDDDMGSCLSYGLLREEKTKNKKKKQPRPGFELGLQISYNDVSNLINTTSPTWCSG